MGLLGCPAASLAAAEQHVCGLVPDWVVRRVRGGKCTTKQALLDDVGAALQLPPWFGESWDALADCLGDLSWLLGDGVVLVVADAHRVLERASRELPVLFGVLGQADPSRPLRVLLHAAHQDEATLRDHLAAAGIAPAVLWRPSPSRRAATERPPARAAPRDGPGRCRA